MTRSSIWAHPNDRIFPREVLWVICVYCCEREVSSNGLTSVWPIPLVILTMTFFYLPELDIRFVWYVSTTLHIDDEISSSIRWLVSQTITTPSWNLWSYMEVRLLYPMFSLYDNFGIGNPKKDPLLFHGQIHIGGRRLIHCHLLCVSIYTKSQSYIPAAHEQYRSAVWPADFSIGQLNFKTTLFCSINFFQMFNG